MSPNLINFLSFHTRKTIGPSQGGNFSLSHKFNEFSFAKVSCFCHGLLCLCLCVCSFSPIQLFVIPLTVAQKVPLSMEFSQQEYWSRLSFPTPGDLPNPGIEPVCPAFPTVQVDSSLLSHWQSPILCYTYL